MISGWTWLLCSCVAHRSVAHVRSFMQPPKLPGNPNHGSALNPLAADSKNQPDQHFFTVFNLDKDITCDSWSTANVAIGDYERRQGRAMQSKEETYTSTPNVHQYPSQMYCCEGCTRTGDVFKNCQGAHCAVCGPSRAQLEKGKKLFQYGKKIPGGGGSTFTMSSGQNSLCGHECGQDEAKTRPITDVSVDPCGDPDSNTPLRTRIEALEAAEMHQIKTARAMLWQVPSEEERAGELDNTIGMREALVATMTSREGKANPLGPASGTIFLHGSFLNPHRLRKLVSMDGYLTQGLWFNMDNVRCLQAVLPSTIFDVIQRSQLGRPMRGTFEEQGIPYTGTDPIIHTSKDFAVATTFAASTVKFASKDSTHWTPGSSWVYVIKPPNPAGFGTDIENQVPQFKPEKEVAVLLGFAWSEVIAFYRVLSDCTTASKDFDQASRQVTATTIAAFGAVDVWFTTRANDHDKHYVTEKIKKAGGGDALRLHELCPERAPGQGCPGMEALETIVGPAVSWTEHIPPGVDANQPQWNHCSEGGIEGAA